MRAFLVYCSLLASFLVVLGMQFVDARGSRKASKRKSSADSCAIVQDNHGFYIVDCSPDKSKTTKSKGKGKGRERETEEKLVNITETETRISKIGEKAGNSISKIEKEQKFYTEKGRCKCPRGKRGSRGRTGAKGARGKTGRRGKNGFPGDDGRDGRPGVPGARGPIGPAGKTGLTGVKGLQGQKGDVGIQGLKGSIGIPGLPGLPGNCIKKTNVGKVASPNFYCLPGKLGPPGPKGARGIVGPKGDPGIMGPKGAKGDLGPEGTRGRPGKPGTPGNLNNFLCSVRYTSWIVIASWDSQFPEVHCNSREFLQGFRMEQMIGRKRFRYTCCKLTK